MPEYSFSGSHRYSFRMGKMGTVINVLIHAIITWKQTKNNQKIQKNTRDFIKFFAARLKFGNMLTYATKLARIFW